MYYVLTMVQPPPKISIMIVDDELSISRSLTAFFTDLGFDAQEFTSGLVALEALKEKKYQVVVVDLSMPEISGLEFISRARKTQGDLGFVVYAGSVDQDQLAKLKELGIASNLILQKPLTSLSEILDVVKKVINHG